MENNREAVRGGQEYRKLVDKFYLENKNLLSEEQYERAKEDPTYFQGLIRDLTNLYQRIGRDLLREDNNYHVWEKRFGCQKEDRG